MQTHRLTAITVAVCLCVSAAALRAEGDEEGVIVAEIPAVVTTDAVVRIDGDTLYLPYQWFCALLQIGGGCSSSGDSIWGDFPYGNHFDIVPARHTLRSRDSAFALTGTVALVRDGLVYVERGALERALGIPLVFLPTDLRLRIDNDTRLPAVSAALRAKRHSSLAFYRAENTSSASVQDGFIAGRPLFGSATVEWLASGSYGDAGSYGFASSRIGAPLLGGVFEVGGYATYTSAPVPRTAFDLQSVGWRLPVEDLPVLRNLSITSSQYGGRRYTALALSNRPTTRPALFAVDAVEGVSRPGWSIELERYGQLLDVARADSAGAFSFLVPVRYGGTAFLLRELGPLGEVVTHLRNYYVSPYFLPPGTVEYQAEVGFDHAETTRPMRAMGSLGVGVAKWLMLEGRADYRTNAAGRGADDSIVAAGRMLLRSDAGLELAAGYDGFIDAATAALSVQVPGVGRLMVNVPAFAPWDDRFRSDASLQFSLGPVGLSIWGQLGEELGVRRGEVTPQVNVQLGRIGASASARLMLPQGEAGGFRPVGSTLQLSTSLFSRLFVNARGVFDHERSRFERVELTGMLPIGRWVRLTVRGGIEDVGGHKGFIRGEVGLDLPEMRATATSDFTRGMLETRTLAEGSIAISESGVRMSRDGGGRESAIELRAFHDVDLDGQWDADEEQLDPPRAELAVDGENAGTIVGEIHGLLAETTYRGLIERWCLADRGVFPRWRAFSAYLLPSTLHTIDVPFAEGMDIYGRCRVIAPHDSASQPATTAALNGLVVRLREVGGCGDYQGDIFSDGSVAVEGVAPGRYRVELDSQQLAVRFLKPAPPFEVDITPEATELPPITLEPADTATAGPASHD